MTVVHLGNANALEARIDPQTGEMVYALIPGERVTTFTIPDSLEGEMAIVQTVLAGLPRMISPDARPWWVECDNSAVQGMLLAHFGLTPENGQRPVTWGDGTTTTVEEKPKKKGAKA